MCLFLVNLWLFIDILEIGCISKPICHWVVIVINLIKQTWLFSMMLPDDVGLCMPRQYRVFPTLAAIIVGRCRVMLATRPCRHSIGISAHLSRGTCRSSPRFWGGLSIFVIARPNSFQICSMGVQSDDPAGRSILVMLLCWRKSRTTPAWWGVALSSW